MDHVLVYRKLHSKHLDYLRKYCRVSYYPEVNEHNREEFLADLTTAHGLFGAAMIITTEMIEQAKHLRVVSNFSAGYDNLDLELLTKKGIMATNAPDALTDTVADLIFSTLLSTARRVTELDRFIRHGKWKKSIGEELFGVDVHHSTIGIIGMGRIGRAVAKRASLGFDMDVLYYKRTRDQEAEEKYNAKYVDKEELLEQSDYICLTVPLTKETRHMISHNDFKLMRPNAILINGARGEIVDEQALIKALRSGNIRGAGLDVFEKEPLDLDNELLFLENVVLTPHIGSATLKARELMVEHGIQNLLAGLRGEIPMNILNEDVLNKS